MMAAELPGRETVSVSLSADLVTELRKVMGEGAFTSLDVLIETWLVGKLSEWLVSRGSVPQGETVQDLVAEKDRLLAWMSNYVAAVQRSEQEMRQALDQIERLKALIPQRPSFS